MTHATMPGSCHRVIFLLALLVLSGGVSFGQTPASDAPRIRQVMGGEYWFGDIDKDIDDYVEYLGKVRPDLVHVGNIGPELASSLGTGHDRRIITPILPAAQSMAAYLQWWAGQLPRIKAHGIRVQCTISMTNAWGDHVQPRGFFRWYQQQWDQDLLGARPTDDGAALMETGPDGQPRRDGDEGWYRYRGCVNKPHWRQVLKRFVKSGVDAGYDGFQVQYPHARGDCVGPCCQVAFRRFIKKNYEPKRIIKELGIADLESHTFAHTAPRPGRHDPIDIAARAFSAACVKDCFDDVFVTYGRSLDDALVLSLWTHFRQFLDPDVTTQKQMTNTDWAALMDERLLLRPNRWGAAEDYVWYSTPVYGTDLARGLLGDAALTHRYVRAMRRGRPHVILNYDYFRWRASAGEAMAGGGAIFNVWKGGWSGGQDRDDPHMKTYFDFTRANTQYLHPREPGGEVALIFPRQALWAGDATFLQPLRRVGRAMLDHHILFDFVIDQHMTAADLRRYRRVVLVDAAYLTDPQRQMLANHTREGGVVLARADQTVQTWRSLPADLTDAAVLAEAIRAARGAGLSSIDASATTLVDVHHQSKTSRLVVHLVNYNRDESQPQRELPIAVDPIRLEFFLPQGARATRATFHTPEVGEPVGLDMKQTADRVGFTTPRFLVYAMVAIEYE